MAKHRMGNDEERRRLNRWPEYADYRPTTLDEGRQRIAAGTHAGTLIVGNLYVTPHRVGEEVDPNAVFLGVLVQTYIEASAGGKHFEDTRALEAWLDEGHRPGAVYITTHLVASEPMTRFSQASAHAPQGYEGQ